MNSEVVSPLTNSKDVALLNTIRVEPIIQRWRDTFKIDISDEFQGITRIYHYQCNETQLGFFLPLSAAGSGRLYEHLGAFDWYYMPQKWEHDVAIRDLLDSRRVLEVGCGKGAFVQRLREEIEIEAIGIELNESAVNYAAQLEIPVYLENLLDLSKQAAETYDAVCAFQVLEHVANPKEFIIACLELVKPGGKLILSVPNSSAFLRYDKNPLLNQPPHHMTHWHQHTFDVLLHMLPMRTKHYRWESLADYHVRWYAGIQAERLSKSGLAKRVVRRAIKTSLSQLGLLRRMIVGHTLYVCFEKTS